MRASYGYIKQDIKDVLFFYAQKGVKPDFIKLKDREKFDLTAIATGIYDGEIGGRAKKEFLEKCWNDGESKWKVFFGFNKKYFLNEIDLILRKLDYPELYEKNKNKPDVVPYERPYEKLSMHELREHDPEYWKKLSDAVFKKYTDEEGYYYSKKSNFRSKSKLKFQIDHIMPMSKGGLTKLDNLQLLTRKENALKGDK